MVIPQQHEKGRLYLSRDSIYMFREREREREREKREREREEKKPRGQTKRVHTSKDRLFFTTAL